MINSVLFSKKCFVTLILLLLIVELHAQMSSSISYSSRDKFVLKSTGEEIPFSELQKYKSENELTMVIPKINEYGVADYYLVDPLNQSRSFEIRNRSAQPIVGEEFPPFSMSSNRGKVSSSDYRDSGIVVVFYEHSIDPIYNKSKMDGLLNFLLDNSNLDIVFVSKSSKDDLIPKLEGLDENRIFAVSDAYNFILRYHIFSMPTIALIGKDSKLIMFDALRPHVRIGSV